MEVVTIIITVIVFGVILKDMWKGGGGDIDGKDFTDQGGNDGCGG